MVSAVYYPSVVANDEFVAKFTYRFKDWNLVTPYCERTLSFPIKDQSTDWIFEEDYLVDEHQDLSKDMLPYVRESDHLRRYNCYHQ